MTTLIILVVLFNLVAFFVPKRRPTIELYTTVLFAVLLASMADLFLDTKYHLYWYFSYHVDWLWLIPLLGGKPAISVLFVNWFPLCRRLLVKVSYILVWAVVLTVFEWLTVYVGDVLHYHGWKLWHSAALYPFLMVLLAAHLYFIRHLLKSDKWF